jgi:hypothetical protein
MKDWNTPDFISASAEELCNIGFISNEHFFTPFRRTICENVSVIEESLKAGQYNVGPLQAGSVESVYGTIYYVYDTKRIGDSEIDNTILDWINEEYKFDKEDESLRSIEWVDRAATPDPPCC